MHSKTHSALLTPGGLSGLFLGLLLLIASLPAQVFVDQLGYLPGASKYLFVSQPADSFLVREISRNTVSFRGALALFSSDDPATGLTLYRGDFSTLETPGSYIIEVPGVGWSFPFLIADTAYRELKRKAVKGYYFQRCGMDLVSQFAGSYFHSKCHLADAFFHSSCDTSGFQETRGGWHDAGDYGKYVVNAGISVGTLLMAYEQMPQQFAFDDLNIPESGNGVPDLLDEIRYELEWLLKMQRPSGGVHFKLTTEQFPSFRMPQQDTWTRYIYQLSTTATGNFAANLAQAARIYQPFDSLFAWRCLNAAEKAWQFLQAHPDILPAGGFQNPPGTNTGQYGDSDDRDERLWAAVELFLTTGNSEYHNYFISHYQEAGLFPGAMSWQNVRSLAQLEYLLGTRDGISQVAQTQLRYGLENYCQNLLQRAGTNGFQVVLNPGEYYWGSNSAVLNNAILLIAAYEKTGNADYRQAALAQLHYILGLNAHRMSFVTQMGDYYPMHIHHAPSVADGIVEPVPGLLAGGPNEYLQDPVLAGNFTASTPAALCYIDDQGSYASNEIAINWNAPLVFVSGYFTPEPLTALHTTTGIQAVADIQLLPNYPNPFNQATTIHFLLAKPQRVYLKIYDLLGRTLRRMDLGVLPSGEHTYRLELDSGRDSLASGIYYFQLEGLSRTSPGKLLYLK